MESPVRRCERPWVHFLRQCTGILRKFNWAVKNSAECIWLLIHSCRRLLDCIATVKNYMICQVEMRGLFNFRSLLFPLSNYKILKLIVIFLQMSHIILYSSQLVGLDLGYNCPARSLIYIRLSQKSAWSNSLIQLLLSLFSIFFLNLLRPPQYTLK